MVEWKIPLYKIYTDDEDVSLITKIVKRGTYWAIGPEIEEFEKISKLNTKKVEDFVTILPPLFAISNNLSVNSISQSNISKNDIFERCFFY